MKHVLYALMVFCAFGLLSCRKSSDNFTIKQYDEDAIQTYIKNNGLSSVMIRDTSGGDTTGIYYQIITPANKSKALIKYSEKISFLYTARSFDGGYSNTDTILNHVYNFPAYVGPTGLQLAIKNIMKQKGAKMRILIPSRLAYGTSGTTITRYTSATTTSTATVGGNQCLDFTVTILDDDVVNGVDKVAAYDDISIVKYLNSKGLLSNFTKITTGAYAGVYYRITKVGTGTDLIKTGSAVGVQYTGSLLNDAVFASIVTDGFVAADTFSIYKDNIIDGLIGALTTSQITAGGDISIYIPSKLAYGLDSHGSSGFIVPGSSCLHFEMTVISVSN